MSTDSDRRTDHEILTEFKTVLWNQAYRTGDVALLDRLLHDRFELIDGDGAVSTKADELKWIATNDWDPEGFFYRIKRLDIFENGTAIVSGVGEATTFLYRSSNVLIKENGRWQAIASHVSGFEEKAPSRSNS